MIARFHRTKNFKFIFPLEIKGLGAMAICINYNKVVGEYSSCSS